MLRVATSGHQVRSNTANTHNIMYHGILQLAWARTTLLPDSLALFTV